MTKYIWAVLLLLFVAPSVQAQEEKVKDFGGPSVKLTAGYGVLLSQEGAKPIPVFTLEGEGPLEIDRLRFAGRLIIGSTAGEIAPGQIERYGSFDAILGLHYPLGGKDYPKARIRTSLGFWFGAETPLDPTIPRKIALKAGLGPMWRELNSGSWIWAGFGFNEEALRFIPDGQIIPEGYYGWGHAMLMWEVSAPGTSNLLLIAGDVTINVKRNEGNNDIAKAWAAFDPGQVLSKLTAPKEDKAAVAAREAALKSLIDESKPATETPPPVE